jgi:FK506-binding protein 1
MGVTKTMISAGNGVDKAQKGDTITMEYTGTLYDEKAADKKGQQ